MAAVLTLQAVAAPETAATRQLPLALTPSEYNNTIADLYGFPRDGNRWPSAPAVARKISPKPTSTVGVFEVRKNDTPPWPWVFPPEPGVEGFEGIGTGQQPSSYQIEALHEAAMHFGSYALVAPRFFDCGNWQSLALNDQQSCAWQSIHRFARRAFRRPVRQSERDRLRTLWRSNVALGPMDEAVALTVSAVLQSPQFLFRVATRSVDVNRLSSWELATRLAYFLWDSMPDEQLFAAADSGQLGSAAEIERQARRMLNDPKARQAVVRFHHQWLGTDNVLRVAPARRAFGPMFGLAPDPPLDTTGDHKWPSILTPIRYSMRFETELFVERTVFDGAGTLTALLTSNQGYMSDYTKPIYGTDARRMPGAAVRRTITLVAGSIGDKRPLTLYPAEFSPTQRAGVLTLPAVLALGAYAVQPGPILRGKRVLERLACMTFGAPIPGAEAALPPDTLNVSSTNRERTAAATDDLPCSACHDQLNPPGFAFEHYDAMGRWRAKDNGQNVDASGSIMLAGGEQIEFSDGIELATKLAASNRVRDCYAVRWARYAIGDQMEFTDPRLDTLKDHFRNHDAIKELLVDIATSEVFRMSGSGDGSGVGSGNSPGGAL